MKPNEIIQKFENLLLPTQKMAFNVAVKAVDQDEQIVYGEVYAPYVIDSHGDMMLPADIKLMAHRFMVQQLNDQIDVMHDNKVIKASAVESFIARDGDPLYSPGAWVMGTKIDDLDVWEACKRGDYAGYSFEAMVRREEADVELSILNQIFGYTQKALAHDHAFYVKLDDAGKVVGGITSVADDGHFHIIKYGTRTEKSNDHTHRFFLP